MHHSRQGVAEPALSQDSAPPTPPRPDTYEQDALRRERSHHELWAGESLPEWQEFARASVHDRHSRPFDSRRGGAA